jgi:ribosome-binding factor A
MSTRRTAKVAAAIRQVVSSAILFELRDPRVKNVTILSTEVPEDLRTAKINISIMGDEKAQRLTLKGLDSAKGWLQSKIADELQLRYTPLVVFHVDHGIQNSVAVAEILRQIQVERGAKDEDELADDWDEEDVDEEDDAVDLTADSDADGGAEE